MSSVGPPEERDEMRGLPCASCGGVFPISSLSTKVACPYCQHAQVVSAEVIRGLDSYEAQVEHKLHRAGAEEMYAQAWERQFGSEGRSREKWIFPAVLGSTLLMVGLSLLARSAGGDFTDGLTVVSWLAPIFVIAAMVYMHRGDRAQKVRRAQSSVLQVACPRCGAPGNIEAGERLDACTYCRAALVPSDEVVTAGIEAAQQTMRSAEMQRYRSERLGMEKISQNRLSRINPSVVGLGAVTMWMLMAAVWVTYIDQTDDDIDFAFVAGLWSATSFMVGLMFWVRRKVRSRKEALSDALRDVARQLGGEHTTGPKLVRWLNTYWAGTFKPGWLYGLDQHQQIAATLGGYPCLVNAGTLSHARGSRPPVHILVAAWIPEISDGQRKKPVRTPEYKAELKIMQQLGFTVTIQPAGLLLHAETSVAKRLRDNAETARQFTTVLHHGVRMVQALGGRAVGAIA